MNAQDDLKGNLFRLRGLSILYASVGLALIILASAWAYRLTVGHHIDQTVDTAGRIANVWSNAITLRPELSINQVTVVGQSTNIFELGTARKEIRVRFDYESTTLGSKRIELEGVYVVNAGFDLNEPFKVDVDTARKTVVATLPRPVVLSVMRRNALHSRETEPFWNRISKEEREMAFNALDTMAKRAARNSGVLDQAREFLEDKLKQTADSMQMKISFRYPDARPPHGDDAVLSVRD